MNPAAGKIIANKFRLTRPLAAGGMGSIWIARHLDLEVDVALKFLNEELVGDDTARTRFKREARAAATLKGPNITHIYDFGVHDGAPYIVMELLDGEDLDALLAHRKWIPIERVDDLVTQLCHGLTLAHDAGIVHRDLKPSNIFIAKSGDRSVVKILDFGIAKDMAPDRSMGHGTASGVLVGSPRYMSPEQSVGETIDRRSDLWSLAVVIYELLTGVSPFDAPTLGQIFTLICTQSPAPPSTLMQHPSPAIDAFFARGLARDPMSRFQSAQELASAFSAVATGRDLPAAGPVPLELADTDREEQGRLREVIDEVIEKIPAITAEVRGRLDATAEIDIPSQPPAAPSDAQIALQQLTRTQPVMEADAVALLEAAKNAPPDASPVSDRPPSSRSAAMVPQSDGRSRLWLVLVVLLIGALGVYFILMR